MASRQTSKTRSDGAYCLWEGSQCFFFWGGHRNSPLVRCEDQAAVLGPEDAAKGRETRQLFGLQRLLRRGRGGGEGGGEGEGVRSSWGLWDRAKSLRRRRSVSELPRTCQVIVSNSVFLGLQLEWSAWQVQLRRCWGARDGIAGLTPDSSCN